MNLTKTRIISLERKWLRNFKWIFILVFVRSFAILVGHDEREMFSHSIFPFVFYISVDIGLLFSLSAANNQMKCELLEMEIW